MRAVRPAPALVCYELAHCAGATCGRRGLCFCAALLTLAKRLCTAALAQGVDASGRLSLRNNAGSVTSYSTSTIAAGGWQRVTLHAVVNGSSSSLDVGLDGVAVSGLSLTGQNLGTAPITKLQLGDTATGRSYDIAFDDVQVSPVSLE